MAADKELWRRTARHLGGCRFGGSQAGATGQRDDEFGDVEQVACRPIGEPQQVAVNGRYGPSVLTGC